jgi:hypothetical protein
MPSAKQEAIKLEFPEKQRSQVFAFKGAPNPGKVRSLQTPLRNTSMQFQTRTGKCKISRNVIFNATKQIRKKSFAGSHSGLPDGLFSNQKIPIWVNFGVPEIKKC